MPLAQTDESCTGGPATLVAIVRAAHLAGDRDLERLARRELDDRYGMKITFSGRRVAAPCPGRRREELP